MPLRLYTILPLGLAAALGFYSIATESLWLDEAFSVALARLDWHELWRLLTADQANMGLYYVLLHFWLRLGTGELAVRSLSAITAIASIAPLYGLGARLFEGNAGIIASLLLAMNAFFIRYAAQEARGYALVLLLATTSSYLFLRTMDKSSAKNWASYVVVSALSIYAHFFGAWVIAAHFVSAMVFRGGFARRQNLIVSHAVIGLLASPLLAVILTTSHLGWLNKPSLETLARFFGALTGYEGPILVIVYCAICSYGLLSASHHQRRAHSWSVPWSYVFLLNWLFLPVLGSFLFSILFKPIFHARYLIIALPPLVLIAAAGVQSLRPAWFKLTTLLLLLVLSGRGLLAWYTGEFPKENWKAATEYVIDNSDPGDGVVFQAAYVRIPFEYYIQTLYSQARAPAPVFPTASWGELDLISPQLSETFREWLTHNRQDHPRLWLVLSHVNLERASSGHASWLPENFERQYCLIRERAFVGIRVMLYEIGSCAPDPT